MTRWRRLDDALCAAMRVLDRPRPWPDGRRGYVCLGPPMGLGWLVRAIDAAHKHLWR